MGALPQNNQRNRYIPALDGIRALAVAAVILYHLNPSLAPGGMQGVTLFFVLSGYLITHLLVIEFKDTGHIDLKGFWQRRLRRIVPAVVAVIVVTAALCTGLNHAMLTKMRPDIIPSALFFNNWWQIFNRESYFSAVGDPSPLTHFWSLAVEMQFYLVWPLILMIALRSGRSERRISRAALALACVSALEMALLYNPTVDPSRVYYGTDTRAFSMLLGAWLALIPHTILADAIRRILSAVGSRGRSASAARTQGDMTDPPLRRVAGHSASAGRTQGDMTDPIEHDRRQVPTSGMGLIGGLGLAGTLGLMAFTNGYSAFPYRGGILLASLFALMLVAACLQPRGILTKLFSQRPLVWLGRRSYSIYLWHYPLLLLMNPARDVTDKPWWIHALQVALVIAVSEASYRLVETPFRNGALKALAHRVRHDRASLPLWAKRHIAPLAVTGITCLIALGGLIFVPATSALSEKGAALLQDGNASTRDATDGKAAGHDDSGISEGSFDITMIGDSVSLRAIDAFNQTFPYGYLDAAMSRQFKAGIDVYRSLIDQGRAGRIAVFALGTNGPLSEQDVDDLMALTGKKRIVVFVNNRAARPWCEPNNQVLADAAARYGNVRVIDWFKASANRNDLFDGDGIHLSDTGVQEYLALIDHEVRAYLPVHLDDASDQRLIAVRRALDGLKSSCALKLSPITVEKEGGGA